MLDPQSPEPARRTEAPRPPDAPRSDPALLMRPAPSSAWRDGPWERMQRFAMDPRVGAVFLVLLAVAAGVAWYRTDVSAPAATGAGTARSSSATQTSALSPAATDTGATGASGSGGTASSETTTGDGNVSSGGTGSKGRVVVVHVAGAVVHPGVVQLRAGSRVIDALEAVGGGVPGADLDRLNLAAKLTDGERVAVPKIGEQPPAEILIDSAGAGGVAGTPTADAPLDLNAATLAQLDELPGIGPSLAAAIVAERTKRGGFGSVNDLRSVRGIGDGRFADLAPLVRVG